MRQPFAAEAAGSEAYMLRFEKMTVKAQEAVQSAQETAASHENQQMDWLNLLVFVARGSFLRALHRFLGFHGHFFKSQHIGLTSSCFCSKGLAHSASPSVLPQFQCRLTSLLKRPSPGCS